jgi:hypothetical protein
VSGSEAAAIALLVVALVAACTPRDACLRHSDCDVGICLAGRCAGAVGGTGGTGGADSGGMGGDATGGTGG